MEHTSSDNHVVNIPWQLFMPKMSDGALTSLSSLQAGFIESMRSIDESLAGDALWEQIAELFPPASFFVLELGDLLSIWTKLWNFLHACGASLPQHSSRPIILTLAHNLYTNVEYRLAAIEMANQIIAAGRRLRTNVLEQQSATTVDTPSVEHSSNERSPEERMAHSVAMRLKNNKQKFSGDLGECLHEYVDQYNQIARDYKLSAAQKLQNLHSILWKDAQQFYLDRVQAFVANFDKAVEMVSCEYNFPVRQTLVKKFLNSLRASDYVSEGLEISAALSKVYRQIPQMSRQVPPSH